VSGLRKVLDPGGARGGASHMLSTRPPGYMLRIEADQLDANRFARLIEEGRLALADGRAPAASSTLGEALSLWRGPPLAEFRDRPFAGAEAARLEELRLTALEERAEA